MFLFRKSLFAAAFIFAATVAVPATSAFAYGVSSGVDAELGYTQKASVKPPIVRSRADEPLELLTDVYKNLKEDVRLPG